VTLIDPRMPYPTRADGAAQTVPRLEPVVWGTGDAGPLEAADVERYARDGYLGVERLLSAVEVDDLRAEVQRLVTAPRPDDERWIRERGGTAVRSIFEVHRLSAVFAELAADERVAGMARQVLGSDVYVHQSRVNLKPGFRGKEFYWHSDFETWHAEDGMPMMRAVSVSISLTRNEAWNGSLMVIPGSHQRFVGCAGATPTDHYRSSLSAQEYGVPSDDALRELVDEGGIAVITGGPGSAVMFDCNAMHGSNGNITPLDRCNVFLVYNSVDNRLVEPFAAPAPRPTFIAARDVEPVGRTVGDLG
jgi:ectoine hydroxylase